MKERLLEILEKTQEVNNSQIDELSEKAFLINANAFETRASKAIGISILPYLASFLLAPFLVENGANPYIITPALIGGSALIGVVGESFLYKRDKNEEIASNAPHFANNVEKEEAKITIGIEIRKRELLNEILKTIAEETLEYNNTEELLGIDNMMQDFANKSASEIAEGIKGFDNELTNNADMINELLNQIIINEYNKNDSNKMNCALGAMVSLLTFIAPNLFMGFMSPGRKPSFWDFFGPGLCCSGAVLGFFTKMNRDNDIALNNVCEVLDIEDIDDDSVQKLKIKLSLYVANSCAILLRRNALMQLLLHKYPDTTNVPEELSPDFLCSSEIPNLRKRLK